MGWNVECSASTSRWLNSVRLLTTKYDLSRVGLVLAFGVTMIVTAVIGFDAAAAQSFEPEHIPSELAESHILQRTYPALPESAKSQHIAGGTVGVEVTISASGDVSSVGRIIGDPTLGEAAAQAVRDWKYRPFLKDGVPIEVVTVQVVEFRTSPPSKKPFVIGWSLFAGLCLLMVLAWVQFTRDSRQHPLWRKRLLLIGLSMLSLSLLQLLVEGIFRYGFGALFWPTHAVGVWVLVNGLICLVAAALCLVGKGAGKWASIAAVPLLYFFWAVHVAV
jgi:TonB family protein